MKKHLVLLLALVATITMASCTRGKYYVKYDVSAPSSHFYGGGTMTLNLNTETGMQRITSSNGVFSGTFGPVSNGFEASVSVSVNYPTNIKTNTVYGYKPIAKSVSRPEYKETHWKDSPDEQSIFLFENTVCRLKEKGIPTFFVFSPNYSYGDYHNLNSYKLLKNIIVSNGYLLTEDYYHHPSLMHNYYFKDKDHLTEEGVEMFSELLAHELKTIN